jgi:large subunit ribosomal protein L19
MGTILESIRQQQLKDNLPDIRPGDTVRVHVRVVEGNRERIQIFEGAVIKVARSGPDRNITVRRIAHNVGVERTFLVHSPRVEKIEVTRKGDVRRARLYYLRQRVGKATRIKEKRFDASRARQIEQEAVVQAVTAEVVEPSVLESEGEIEEQVPQEVVD